MAFISTFHAPLNSVFYQTNISRKMSKILEILWNPGSRIRVGFCRFAWGSYNFIKKIHCYIKHFNMVNQAQYSEAPKIIMFCNNCRLNIKRPRAWNVSVSALWSFKACRFQEATYSIMIFEVNGAMTSGRYMTFDRKYFCRTRLDETV